MSKILILILVIAVVYWILKAYRRRMDRRPGPPPGAGEDMVRCAHCGIHLPRSESLVTRGHYYCSAEHRRRHAAPD